MKKQKVLAALLLAASAALAIAAWFLLPETVITQVSLNEGGATTMPKILAIAIPTVLGVGFSAFCLLRKDHDAENRKPLLVSVVGVVLFVIMLIVNH